MKCYFSILYNQFEKTLGDFGSIFFCTFILIDCQYIYIVKRYIKTPKQGKTKQERKYVQITNTIFAYHDNQGLPKTCQSRLTIIANTPPQVGA